MTPNLSRFSIALCLLSLPLAAPALGQTATMVREINPRQFSEGASPQDLTPFQGKVYFSAGDPNAGRELWVTDGQGTGTRMLADLCPGECSSNPVILGSSRSLLFGLASEGDFSPRTAYLWRSDGTPEGTFLLPDASRRVRIDYDFFFDDPVLTAFAGDRLYFAAETGEGNTELWVSDGTPEGTHVVVDLPPGSGVISPEELVAVGNQLFFSTYRHLWRTDGTPEGTVLVKEFTHSTASPRRLAALGDRLLFLAPATGEELWVSDGTPEGTRAITDFAAPTPFQQTLFLKQLGGKVYFVADDVTHGAELWASDGTAPGTVRVTEFGFHDPFGSNGFSDSGLFPGALESVGDRIVFWATDGVSGLKLWTTTGSPASTAPVCASCTFHDQGPLLKLGGRLFFVAGEGDRGTELWRTDGTARGTGLVVDLCSQIRCDGVRSQLRQAGPWLFFEGPGNPSYEPALWRSDGSRAGTRLFASIQPRGSAGIEVAALGGERVVFSGESQDLDRVDLWSGDGTPEGTRKLTGFSRAGGSADLQDLVTAGNRVYFTACDEQEVRRVWWSDGTASGTGVTPEPLMSCDRQRSPLAVAGGKVFLFQEDYPFGHRIWRISEDGQTAPLTGDTLDVVLDSIVSYKDQIFFVVRGTEIWKSDGTPQGTGPVIDSSAELEYIKHLHVVGSELWFLAEDRRSALRGGIWRTDGTRAGLQRITDNLSISPHRRDPELTRIGTTVYFLGNDFSSEPVLWKTDGTGAGTVEVANFNPDFRGIIGYPAELTVFQGALYFFANTNTANTRRALWKSDGTPAGTVVLKEFVVPDFFHFGVPRTGLTVFGSRLVFAANDGIHGIELWTSDGTAAGTRMLRDLLPGSEGSRPGGFREAGGRLYFSAADGLHGFELWQTDGTAAGTRLVQDLSPEGASSSPAGLTLLGDRLFFSANDGLAGEELWVLPLGGPACQPSPTVLCLSGGRFKVEVSWSDFDGNTGSGRAVPLTADTGYFWFFGPENVEVVLKVLDGQGVNGHHWVFYGALSNVEYLLTVTDTRTGLARRYFNPSGNLASVGDTEGFGPRGAHLAKSLTVAKAGPPPLVSERTGLAAATGVCVPSATRLCLNGGRFAAEISWKDFSGNTGTGTAVGLTGDTGYFWFFNAANVEVVVKVLDGQPVNGKHWVFYGALSSVEYTLTVTDTATGKVKTYRNPSGRLGSVADTGAF